MVEESRMEFDQSFVDFSCSSVRLGNPGKAEHRDDFPFPSLNCWKSGDFLRIGPTEVWEGQWMVAEGRMEFGQSFAYSSHLVVQK